MNSFAHYSFGAVYAWMVDNIGGIRRVAPAYEKILIAPQPDGRLRSAAVSYRSPHGLIATDWKYRGDTFLLNVTIPPNTTATVALPARSAAAITESGRPLDKADSVKLLGVEGSKAYLAIGSGQYAFAAKQGK